MKKTYFYAGVSIFCWSTMATTSKMLLGELNNFQLLWMNSLIATLFLIILNAFAGNFKKHHDYRLKDYLIMAAIGMPGTLFYYLFYYAGTDILPASQAFIINYLWPIMSVIFACIILKEKLSVRKVVAIAVSFAGIIIVMGNDLTALDPKVFGGALCCVMGAVSYGIFTALNQKFNYNKSMSLMVSYFATFVVTTAINIVKSDLFMPRIDQMAGFLWNGIFAVAVANTLWVIALENGKTAKISNFAYITPFLSSVWTFIFLKEPITVYSMAGLIVIVLGIFIQLNDKDKSENDTTVQIRHT